MTGSKDELARGEWMSSAEVPVMKGPPEAVWEEVEVPAGQHLANLTGSLHQSFTGKEGCVLLILWSGCHANIPYRRHANGTSQTHYYDPRLHPGAGWAF